MKDHPLTPMRDANLVRVLQRQTRRSVGLVGYEAVAAGADAVRAAFARQKAAGHGIVIVDAVTDAHLRTIGAAAHDLAVITGGSGVAMGLPQAYGITARPSANLRMSAPRGRPGRSRRLVLRCDPCAGRDRDKSGHSIVQDRSPRTRVRRADAGAVLDWIARQKTDRPILVYSSADPDSVSRVQAELGRARSGALVETLLADVARALPDHGFARLIVAGGETAGAVVAALGVQALRIGPEIDPGVPWTRTFTASTSRSRSSQAISALPISSSRPGISSPRACPAKVGTGFAKRTCSNKNRERDGDLKKVIPL